MLRRGAIYLAAPRVSKNTGDSAHELIFIRSARIRHWWSSYIRR
jgi:hypothetical protein